MQRPQRIYQLLESPSVTVAGKIVQPVARLDGWWWPLGVAGEGAVARLAPASVTVRAGDQHYAVPIDDPSQSTLRTFLLLGGAVTLVCLFVMLLTVLFTRRRSLGS